ncbi:MAG: helicase-related protein [Ruthenibacterium lactatiformans]
MEYDAGVVAGPCARADRGGQAYYIHNRIDTIDQCAAKLAELLPGARIATAHGRMDEATLSGVWQKLLDGEIDVLVCTTLIETGVDGATATRSS